MASEQPLDSGHRGDLRPVPDPTELTTKATDRLEATLRNLITTEIRNMTILVGEKLKGVEDRFSRLESRTAEQKSDTKDALDAALAAAKEAVATQAASFEKATNKSETTFTENIRGVAALLNSTTKAADDKYDDLKERVVAIESRQSGGRENSVDYRNGITLTISLIMALIGIVSFTIAQLHK